MNKSLSIFYQVGLSLAQHVLVVRLISLSFTFLGAVFCNGAVFIYVNRRATMAKSAAKTAAIGVLKTSAIAILLVWLSEVGRLI